MTIKGKLKFGQFFKTRNGDIGVFFGKSTDPEYPVIAGILGELGSRSYTKDGKFILGEESGYDIVELLDAPPSEPREWDVVVVEAPGGNTFPTMSVEDWKPPLYKILARVKVREGEGV